MCLRPALGPRRDRSARPLRQIDTAPRIGNDEGSPRRVISGLNHTASALAVYASPGELPHKTQDSLLAAGQLYQAGLITRRVPTKGFRDVSYIAFSFPKLLGAIPTHFPGRRPIFRVDPFVRVHFPGAPTRFPGAIFRV
jgi:hypothetical protein